MGRLELWIPLTEVVIVEEDLRQGLMKIIVEGEEYPNWSVGCAVMLMMIDQGNSLVEMGNRMMEMVDRKAKLKREAEKTQLFYNFKRS